MAVRSKKSWKPDNRGRYSRNLGMARKPNGKVESHRFYLGTNLTEAKRRNDRLEDLWKCVEKRHDQFGWPLEWNNITLLIGREISKGNYRIIVPRKKNHPESYARYINRLQSSFPMVSFVPEEDEQQAYDQGAMQARSLAMSSMKRQTAKYRATIENKLVRGGGLAASEVFSGEETLHEALNSYIEEIKAHDVVPGTESLTDNGHTRIRTSMRLIGRSENVPLSSLNTFDSVQSIVNVWRSRPMVKNSDPPRPITKNVAQAHISELLRFCRWLNRTALYEWEKPKNFDELDTNVSETAAEKKSKHSHTQVDTYDLEQLKLLYKYSKPMERLMLMLGLNCGFGAAEQGRIAFADLYLNQIHPNAKLLKQIQDYEANPDDSYILCPRPKTNVWGEWYLWPQTIEAIQWGITRRKEQGEIDDNSVLMTTERLTPMFHQTAGGHRGQNFNRQWNHLTKRIRKDHKEFPKLSFGKLRKTAGNLVRHTHSGEASGVFLCHGSPVKTDDLIGLYTNSPYAKVFNALKDLEEKLQPVFSA